MPRLSIQVLLITVVLGASVARADGVMTSAGSGRRWNLDLRAGYAGSWTTGQSYLGIGVGLAAGVTLRVPVHFEVGALYHGGSTVSAENDTIEYWSRNWSVLTHAAAGYAWTLETGVVVRPQAIIGCVVISDSMRLGDVTRDGLDPLLVGGLGIVLLAEFDGLHFGIDARALSVPSRIASPIGGIYLVLGWPL